MARTLPIHKAKEIQSTPNLLDPSISISNHNHTQHAVNFSPSSVMKFRRKEGWILSTILIVCIFCGLAFNLQMKSVVSIYHNDKYESNSNTPTTINNSVNKINRYLHEENNQYVIGTTNSAVTFKNVNNDWPGQPVEEVGHPLVFKGVNFVANSRQLLFEKYFDEFMQVYIKRPDPINMCGIRFNHAYALFLTVKVLEPTTVVESGVNAGQSTYFIRAASPNTTKIIPIDPLDEPICDQKERWIDTVNSEYYTGKEKFKDLEDIDWETKIATGEVDPKKTLIFIDDHLVFFDRFLLFLKFGFRHILIEDNYKAGHGSTHGDKIGFTAKQLLSRKDDDSIFFWNQLVSYAEFPPLVPPKHSFDRPHKSGFLHRDDNNTDMVEPLLRPDLSEADQQLFEKIATALKEDPNIGDSQSFLQFMNYNSFAYMELLPLSPRLAQRVKIIDKRSLRFRPKRRIP